jgi:hypothetical protein
VLVGPLGFPPGLRRVAAQSQTMVDSDDSDNDDAIMAFALASSVQLAFLID